MCDQEILTCRRTLSIMVITCFCLLQMHRVNLSIAIVPMTSNTTSDHFDWTEKQKGDILGSILWGQMVMSVPGGRLSEIYGTRILLGTMMVLASVLTLLTPFIAHYNYHMLLLSRVGVGLMMGVVNTCIPAMAIRWVAPTHMSKFLSHTRAIHLGGALTLPICGYVIANWGWKQVFFLTGGLSVVWTIFWFGLVYDSPSEHPRISVEEIESIRKGITCDFGSLRKKDIPWGKILASRPVWANVVSSACVFFSVNLAINNLPSYMNQVLQYDIKQNGLLCSLPYLAMYLSAFGSSHWADRWYKTSKFSKSTIRTIFVVLTFGGPAGMFAVAAFYGDRPKVCVVVFVLWLSFSGCSVPSLNANVVDFAPTYVGTIFGIMQMVGALAGYGQTKLVAVAVQEGQGLSQWKFVFWVMMGVNLFGMVVFLLFSSTEVQSWNLSSEDAEVEKRGDGDEIPLQGKILKITT